MIYCTWGEQIPLTTSTHFCTLLVKKKKFKFSSKQKYIKNNVLHLCNGKNIFIRWKMETPYHDPHPPPPWLHKTKKIYSLYQDKTLGMYMFLCNYILANLVTQWNNHQICTNRRSTFRKSGRGCHFYQKRDPFLRIFLEI